jgi:ZIP family zinc transporter
MNLEAALWGAGAASALLVGALVAVKARPRRRDVGLSMGVGAGALISAVAFQLVEEALDVTQGFLWVGLGLALGAVAFFIGDLLIDRRGGEHRKRFTGAAEAPATTRPSPMAIVLGSILDGVPESIVIGTSVAIGRTSVAMVAAVALSNLTEGLGATDGLRRGGASSRSILWLWLGIVAISGVAAALGAFVAEAAPDEVAAFAQAFAAGAVLTMLADVMMPEAEREGGMATGLFVVAGFAFAVWISGFE